MTTIAKEARITGRVQGVAYRNWTRSRASALGLTGWVRNDPMGAVVACFEGERDKIETMLTDLWSGPGAASVTDVQSHTVAPTNARDFVIRR
ncbi:acylphosphatase [Shimia sp. CNT1-13L.2]|jgi:acylphosphatase|uniref:acylphosphatase n=1 Tax=Shimia sp. CNT1-13L.2 TaxID=2959663 RepID=UPI0020CCC0C9|nr:acylphosphatase [Shimia sp. CNT1-13L.2]MCP9480556.1 acylphosphatase [Shimia sp. CNT1-13L.2]